MNWEDVFPLNCIPKVVFSAEDVWFPDVAIINSGDKYSMPLARGHKIEVDQNGESVYYPSGTFSTSCDLNLRYFPFDKQKCVLLVGSWCYWKEMQPFIFNDPPIDLSNLTSNEQWSLVKAEAVAHDYIYPLDPRTWQKIEWVLYLERKSTYYIINVIVPSCIISVVEIVTFSLPLQKAVKIHISFTSLLAYSVFQLMIIGDIPRASEHTPLLTIYIDLSMAYIGFVLLGEGLVFVCLDRMAFSKEHGPPSFIFEIVSFIGQLYGYNRKNYKKYLNKMSQVEKELDESFRTNTTEKWAPKSQYTPEFFKITGTMMIPDSEPALDIAIDQKKPANTTKFGNDTMGSDSRNRQMVIDRKKRLKEEVNVEKWLTMAKIIDRFVLSVYITAIIVTPIIIFVILPALDPIRENEA